MLWDEASLGYNAYSVLKTGRDEHGAFLPLIFESFGDYKPGFYVYLCLPLVWLLGLNELAVRLPSIILGSLMPLVLYFLVKEIFKNQRLAFFSALVLALLPWGIHFSRGAWESNVLAFFLVWGSYLFLKKSRFSLIPFLLGLWTYQGGKMLIPLVLLVLFGFGFIKLRSFFSNWLNYLVLVLIALWYFQSFSGLAGNRLKVMSLFSYRQPEEEKAVILKEEGKNQPDFHFYFFHNQGLYFLRGFLVRYFNHFSPRFLAFEGDWTNPRHSAPYFGAIGQINFLFLILGLGLFISRKRKLSEHFFLFWLFLAPLPAALSRDIVSGVRSLAMIVPIAFFIGFGLNQLLKFRIFKSKLVLFFLIFFYSLNFFYYLDLYYCHLLKKSPKNWLYGHKEVISYLLKRKDNFQNIVLTDFYGQPYIYYLFYSKYSPSEYQEKGEMTESQFADVGRVEKLDQISFRPIDWSKDKDLEKTLVILSQDEVFRNELEKKPEFMAQLAPLGEIDNQAMFYAYEKN